ncbi:hypothetical protein BGZ52_013252, partial [Haplosporangium bisporale]
LRRSTNGSRTCRTMSRLWKRWPLFRWTMSSRKSSPPSNLGSVSCQRRNAQLRCIHSSSIRRRSRSASSSRFCSSWPRRTLSALSCRPLLARKVT